MNKPKFRAWDKTKKEMINVATVEFNRLSGEISGVQYWIGHNTLGHIHGKNIVLMQYTGLNDKNGVEIYFDDALTNGETIRRVIWRADDSQIQLSVDDGNYGTRIKLTQQMIDTFALTVCGDIYKNPELLSEVE